MTYFKDLSYLVADAIEESMHTIHTEEAVLLLADSISDSYTRVTDEELQKMTAKEAEGKICIRWDKSDIVISGVWYNTYDRRSFLELVYIKMAQIPEYDVSIDYDSSKSSAGEVRIRPKEGYKLADNIRRISIVCKPLQGQCNYSEVEKKFASLFSTICKCAEIRNIDFVDDEGGSYSYSISQGDKYSECFHVGTMGGKADVLLVNTCGGINNISLKLSNAEYVSKQSLLLNNAISKFYIVTESNQSIQIESKLTGNKATFPLDSNNNLDKPKRIYLSLPDSNIIDAALFGDKSDLNNRCDFVCIVGDDVFDVEKRLQLNNNNSITYKAKKIIDPSCTTLTDDICICIRNSDKGRKGLKLASGEYIKELLPTLVFRRNKVYSLE